MIKYLVFSTTQGNSMIQPQIKYIHIAELYSKLNPNNPKIHNIEFITNSILQYGFYSVVVVNKNGAISAGNGRTKALMALYQSGAKIRGMVSNDWLIPTIESDLTGDDLYKFLVDDNLAGVISGGLNQLNNAQLIDNLNPDNLPLGISKADYDFMLKVFANDFKGEPLPDNKPKEPKPKLKKINITFLDETLYEEIFAELDKLLESYILAEQIRMK